MTLSDFFEDFYQPLRLVGRSPRTLTLYDYSIRLFGDTLKRPATLKDLDDLTVSRHLQRLHLQGYSPHSINKERDQLLAIWRLAARKKLVDEFPEVQRLPAPRNIPQAWTLDEIGRLISAAENQPGEYYGVPAGLWWAARITLCYATGERTTAIGLAKWSDLRNSVIEFPPENRKGKQSPNIVELPAYAMKRLGKIRTPSRDLIFPWPYGETYQYHVFSQINRRAGLPDGSKHKFHCLRRTHATQLKIAGGDPSTSLGHSNPATTARYIDTRQTGDGKRSRLPKI
jgi:integrase